MHVKLGGDSPCGSQGGGYAVQRVYRYSNGKADVAPDYYQKQR